MPTSIHEHPATPLEADWLTADQAATALHVTVHHVHRNVRAGIIPTQKLGTFTVIPRTWVDAAASTRTMAASRTRIDWAAAMSMYLHDPATSPHNNDATPGSRTTRHEHALEHLPAPAG